MINVEEAIASHRFRGRQPPQSLEARILSDADKLDAMGAIGIARSYAIAGAEGQRLWADVEGEYAADADVAPGEHAPVHEWLCKLSRLHDSLHTETARRVGRRRHAFMQAFFRRLRREVAGTDAV